MNIFRLKKDRLNYRAFLDDVEVSKYVSNVSINIRGGYIPEVILTLNVTNVDIPEELISHVIVEEEMKEYCTCLNKPSPARIMYHEPCNLCGKMHKKDKK